MMIERYRWENTDPALYWRYSLGMNTHRGRVARKAIDAWYEANGGREALIDQMRRQRHSHQSAPPSTRRYEAELAARSAKIDGRTKAARRAKAEHRAWMLQHLVENKGHPRDRVEAFLSR